MKQEQLDNLITDAFELHIYSDMSELAEFFDNLAMKYALHFDKDLFTSSGCNNAAVYWSKV